MIIDYNERINPIIENVRVINKETAQRILDVALPFFMLYRPLNLAVSTFLGGVKTWQILTDLPGSDRTRWLKQVGQLALTVSTVALAFFMPLTGALLSQGYQLVVTIDRLRASLALGDWKEAMMATLSIAATLSFSASLIYATPEILVISLLAQAIFELAGSMGEIRKGRYLEAAGKAAMAALRVWQAVPLTQTLHRNYYGTKLNRNRFKKVVREAERTGKTFEEVLKRRYWSSHIENLDLSEKEYRDLTFDNLRFKNCNLDYTEAENCQFLNVKFTDCTFESFNALNSIFSRSAFNRCNLNNMAFFNGALHEVSFTASDLTRTCFNHSAVISTQYKDCKLLETSFLETRVEKSKLIGCDLTDTLLCGTQAHFTIRGGTPNRFTRPVVALGWNFDTNQNMASVIHRALRDKQIIPLRYDYTPPEINPDDLEKEVRQLLPTLRKEGSNFLSIGDELLQKAPAGSQIGHIKQIADSVVRYSQALVIPGGYDVQPELYGEKETIHTYSDHDFRRSILELALIRSADKQSLPLMGICRGSQIINVYYGGTLKQDIEGHDYHWHTMQVSPNAPQTVQKIVQDIIGEKIVGIHMHHQASDKIGKGLHVAIEVDGTPETLVSADGRILTTQFHPEIYMNYQGSASFESPEYKVNANFFTHLYQRASQYSLMT